MTKTLILIRHGHRDTSQRELDNGLDDKGREQAKAIKTFFGQRFGPEELKRGLWIVSSPKLRCQETLLATAKSLDRAVDVHPDLDEQNGKESGQLLEKRVHRFLHEWAQSKAGLTVLCSHGDWLPLATHHLLGTAQEFKKGGWLEIDWISGRERNSGSAALKWYVPTFKTFFK